MLKMICNGRDYEVYENDRLVGVGRTYEGGLAIIRLMNYVKNPETNSFQTKYTFYEVRSYTDDGRLTVTEVPQIEL